MSVIRHYLDNNGNDLIVESSLGISLANYTEQQALTPEKRDEIVKKNKEKFPYIEDTTVADLKAQVKALKANYDDLKANVDKIKKP